MAQVRRNAVDTVYYPAAQGVSLLTEREKHVDCKPPMFILVNFRCIQLCGNELGHACWRKWGPRFAPATS